MEDGVRKIGERASLKDLNHVMFNIKQSFVEGELVLVGRSTGGFTYGEVAGPRKFVCSQNEDGSHRVSGFRVCIDSEKTMRKDLIPGSIGKLPISESVSLPSLPKTVSSSVKAQLERENNYTSSKQADEDDLDDLDDEVICWDPKAYLKDSNHNLSETTFQNTSNNIHRHHQDDEEEQGSGFNFDFDSLDNESYKNGGESSSPTLPSSFDLSKNANPNVIKAKKDICSTSVIKFEKDAFPESTSGDKSPKKCVVVLDVPNIAKVFF